MKFSPEGYPFIISSLLFSGTAAVIFLWTLRNGSNHFIIYLSAFLLGFSLILVFFMGFFFRDPERSIPGDEGVFVSPADGKVIKVIDIPDNQYTGDEAKEISIFMSPLDVHVNRSPCDGRVMSVRYAPGQFMTAYKDDASLRNEHIDMLIEHGEGRVLVRQVAGFVARRAVCRAKEGDYLRRGERNGIIKFSAWRCCET